MMKMPNFITRPIMWAEVGSRPLLICLFSSRLISMDSWYMNRPTMRMTVTTSTAPGEIQLS